MSGMKRRMYNDGGVVTAIKSQRSRMDAAIERQTAPAPTPAVTRSTQPTAPVPIAAGSPRQPNESLSDYEGRRNREWQQATQPAPAAPAPKKSFWPFAKGGKVPGKGNTDTVPAMLTPGEFVVTKGATKMVGAKKLHELNARAKGMKRRSKR